MNSRGFWGGELARQAPGAPVPPPAPTLPSVTHGPQVTPSHLGGSHVTQPDMCTFMPDVWGYLIAKFHIDSVLDVGCGGGFSTKWFIDNGLSALGIEGDPAALAARKCDPVLAHDFAAGPIRLVGTYDLGWAAEFLEHVEERFMPNWMAALQRCRRVVVTHALPGQGGHHHVNEQTTDYWIGKFGLFGFKHVPVETAALRATHKGEPWGRNTLTFFENRNMP
jgi:SAM-dependent methyltransferase